MGEPRKNGLAHHSIFHKVVVVVAQVLHLLSCLIRGPGEAIKDMLRRPCRHSTLLCLVGSSVGGLRGTPLRVGLQYLAQLVSFASELDRFRGRGEGDID
ncbi:hypothetical protein [Streptomyces sp. NPDC059215]|uniref:hypothetical protein n=1 Tax=Streptomyces sp. NPDC059215 TaxID=3346772 RepID=UPI0036A5D2D3